MKFRELLILAGGVAAAAQANALSLGNSQGQVQLGAPIDLVFPVQPDAGKAADSSCITADVWMGDTALASSQITLLPQGNVVRLRTRSPVYEPLVTVKLHAGCAGTISRSYTFFADPPRSVAASVEPIDLSKIQLSTAAAATAARPAPAARAEKKPRAAKRPVAPQASTAKPAAVAPAATAATTPAPQAPESSQVPDTPPSPAARSAAAPSANDQSRLRVEPIEGLEQPESTLTPQATENLPASSPAIDPSTKLVLDANAARLEAMEKQLQALQTQLTNNRTEMVGLQTQLAQAQNQELPAWVNIMLALLALALAAIAWLLQRLKQERQRAQRAWADTLLAVDDSAQATTIDTHAQPAATPSTPARAETEQPSATPAAASTPAPAPQPTPLEPPAWNSAEASPPTLMPDELYAEFEKLSAPPLTAPDTSAIAEVLTAQALFDVQEQAEFYASIGENDQAIEILQSHIAQHETSSPLAYIELLQLLYRLSRTEAFEQVRLQFQSHFNVNVPEFMGFARKGNDLWSGYPDALGQIEALWPTDEVQALLRSFIVRQPGSTPPSAAGVRFDLSAFDDLLMLYNVAQTTPAASRGQLPGRTRTAPTEIPLPELVLDTAPAAPGHSTASTSLPSIALQDASLDMLNTVSTPAPLAPEQPLGDSPFQGPAHFAPNEALVDGLTLDWDMAAPPASAPPAATTMPDQAALPDLDALNTEFGTFSMDERDLPPSPPR